MAVTDTVADGAGLRWRTALTEQGADGGRCCAGPALRRFGGARLSASQHWGGRGVRGVNQARIDFGHGARGRQKGRKASTNSSCNYYGVVNDQLDWQAAL
jgi:hypothetical protein